MVMIPMLHGDDPNATSKLNSTLVLEEGVVLLLHGGLQKGISNSLAIRLWI
jgi:hypothetical protein